MPETVLTAEEQTLLTHCEEAYAGYPGVHVLALCQLVRRLEAELEATDRVYREEMGTD